MANTKTATQNTAAAVGGTTTKKTTALSLTVGQENYDFQITVATCRELEDEIDRGPMEVYNRIVGGKATAHEVSAVIRAGLKGSGAARPGPALDKIVNDRPFADAVNVAEAIMAAFLVGVDVPDAVEA